MYFILSIGILSIVVGAVVLNTEKITKSLEKSKSKFEAIASGLHGHSDN